ncbi:MAG: adenylate kinase family protein [Candidatus Hodarchaeales archaeon]
MTLYFIGTPGTGKSTIARTVATKLNFEMLEINDLVKERSFFIGYDVFRDSLIIDEPLICNYLTPILEANSQICLCGPILELPPRFFEMIFVLRCNPGILRTRLSARGYDAGKVEENVEAEIMEIVAEEARTIYGDSVPICEIDTSGYSFSKAADAAIRKLESPE